MADRLFGTETEYALSTVRGATARGATDRAATSRLAPLTRLMQLAQTRLVHLTDGGNGMFLENGSRFYLDAGGHPELSTPECMTPWDAVRYVLAGNEILARLINELNRRRSRSSLFLTRCNVDYSGSGSTWGCHESYLTTGDPKRLYRQILPHLVSRLIYTGAGGFNNLTGGVEFTLSPRVPHLTEVMSSDSTHSRGIVHTKNEPLCRGNTHRRLHLLCGESLCSETAAWLKVGTTALVVALIEAGIDPGSEVQLTNPLGAIRSFAADPTCTAGAYTTNGYPLSAIAIQRHYLVQAESKLGAAFMPSWAPVVCQAWREILDRLDGAPDSVATVLDWAIKRTMFKRFTEQHGIAWESLPHWTGVVKRLFRALERSGHRALTARADFILGAASPVADTVRHLRPLMRAKHLEWDALAPYLDIRTKLFELDARFSQLGGEGIFSRLERQGVLDHHVPGVDCIDSATTNPPATGRARARGRAIRQLAGRRDRRIRATWQAVVDEENNRKLDLSDPFVTEASWQDLPAGGARPERHDSLTMRVRAYEEARRRARGEREDDMPEAQFRIRFRERLRDALATAENEFLRRTRQGHSDGD